MLFPTEYIYILNIVVIAILALFAYSGYRQGFLLKILGCIGFMVCGFLAWALSSPFSKLLHLLPEDMSPMADTIAGPIFYDSINRILVFIVLFLVLGVIVLFLKPLLKMVGKLPVIHEVNTIFGTIIGAIQGEVVIVVITFVFGTPLFANGTKVIQDSFLSPVEPITEGVLFFASDRLEELKSIQKIVTPSTALTQEDVIYIKGWLMDYDLPETQVDAFIHELVGD